MRHLSTEELLLQCDSELSFARVAHLQGCALCKAALADLKQLLFEVEQELRATVPQEPVEERLASWLALERTLYPPPKNSGFPIRWPVVYATAAALTIAVFAGYLASRQTTIGTPPATIAANVSQPSIRVAASAAATLGEAPLMADSAAAPSDIVVANVAPVTTLPVVIQTSNLVQPATDAEAASPDNPVVPIQRQRFEFNEAHEESLASAGRPLVSAVLREGLDLQPVLTTEMASVSAPPMAVSRPRPLLDAALANTPEAAAALVEGHWILTQANVWTEDVRPVWTGAAIEFQGTVENTSVQKLVTAEIEKAAGSKKPFSIAFALQLRPRDGHSQMATSAVTLPADKRPAGGVVRNSLLAHFGDAARRSFVSPQPTILEAEIDRFVTDVFRGQSSLRSHSYALKSLMRLLTPQQVAQLHPSAAKKFRGLVRMHIDAVGEEEQNIYGRLSETLPRRFWSYRAAERELSGDADWQNESADLLKEVLQLDATLTALLSTPQSFVDVSDSHLSSGELLYRIRSRVHRIRAAAEMAR